MLKKSLALLRLECKIYLSHDRRESTCPTLTRLPCANYSRCVAPPLRPRPGSVRDVTTKEYEEDEFDRAADSQPAGAHRQPVSRLKLAWPFLVAIVVAPLLAWGFVTLYTSLSGTPAATPTPTPTQQETQAPTPTVEVHKDTAVTVYNAAGVQGMAAKAAEKITADGFTKVSATNANARGVSASTVYYTSEDLKDTAESVASLLGIESVAPKPQGFQMPDGVVVYLLKDYQAR